MQNLGTFFLCALATCTLCHGSLAKDPRSGHMLDNIVEAQDQVSPRDADNEIKLKLDRLVVKLGEVQAKQEEQLQGVEAKLEGQQTTLTKIENKLQAILNKMEAPKEAANVETSNSATNTTIIPSGFERFGTRYFKIVEEYVDWETANRRCRELGGFLASFQNKEEITAMAARVDKNLYWLGIHDQDTEGHFVSVATQKPAKFLNWEEDEPDKYYQKNCVALLHGKMVDYNCDLYFSYICQADNET